MGDEGTGDRVGFKRQAGMVHASHGVVEVSALGSGIQREECGIRFGPEACGRRVWEFTAPSESCLCLHIDCSHKEKDNSNR